MVYTNCTKTINNTDLLITFSVHVKCIFSMRYSFSGVIVLYICWCCFLYHSQDCYFYCRLFLDGRSTVDCNLGRFAYSDSNGRPLRADKMYDAFYATLISCCLINAPQPSLKNALMNWTGSYVHVLTGLRTEHLMYFEMLVVSSCQ